MCRYAQTLTLLHNIVTYTVQAWEIKRSNFSDSWFLCWDATIDMPGLNSSPGTSGSTCCCPVGQWISCWIFLKAFWTSSIHLCLLPRLSSTLNTIHSFIFSKSSSILTVKWCRLSPLAFLHPRVPSSASHRKAMRHVYVKSKRISFCPPHHLQRHQLSHSFSVPSIIAHTFTSHFK